MEISSDTIIQLVKGQGQIEQALLDMGKRIDIALPTLAGQQKELDDRVDKVENKLWYFSGIGTAAGIAVGHALTWLKK